MTERRIVISPLQGAAIEWGRTALDSFSVPQHTRSSEIKQSGVRFAKSICHFGAGREPIAKRAFLVLSIFESESGRAGERESNHFSVLYLAAGT